MRYPQPSSSSEVNHSIDVNTLDINTLPDTDWYTTAGASEFDDFDFSSLILTPPTSPPVTPELPRGLIHRNAPDSPPHKIFVSFAFPPDADNDKLPTDVIFLTCDSVYFYVHKHKLLTASDNCFNNIFPVARQEAHRFDSDNAGAVHLTMGSRKFFDGKRAVSDPVIPLPESSPIINILLHVIYGKSLSHFTPTFEDSELSLNALVLYGVSLQRYVVPGSPLFDSLLDFSSTHAMPLYSLAAKHNLYPLAVSVSPHLLSFPLSFLSDDMAGKLGGFYTKKLFIMHTGRTDALKRLLFPPPRSHPPTFMCDVEEQDKLSRAWTLTCAYILWDAKADISLENTASVLNSLGEKLHCEVCKMSLKMRIRTFSSEWGQVKASKAVHFNFIGDKG